MTSKNIEAKRYQGDIMNSMGVKISATICYELKICKNPERKICTNYGRKIGKSYEVPMAKIICKNYVGKMRKFLNV